MARSAMARPVKALDIENRVARLEGLDLQGLRAIWAEDFGPPPKLRSPDLLRMMLGWRLQACMLGGLDSEFRRQIARKGPARAEGHDLGTGAVLRRNWRGKRIEVTIEQEGFRYDGTIWKSLSAIAHAATGTRWNGPRFFGLREGNP